MEKLVDGIHRFQSEIFGSKRDLFEKLAHGQHPEALLITCSDSRIAANLITQTQPGDLFILRNAGNIVPPWSSSNGGEAATIEFAVGGLGIRDVIVCGHSQCGAMKGLLHPETLTELPALRGFLTHAESTRRIIRENYTHLEGAALLTATIEENVLVQLENLRTHPVVQSHLKRGDLRLHGWVYKLETGAMFNFDNDVKQFRPFKTRAGTPLANIAQAI